MQRRDFVKIAGAAAGSALIAPHIFGKKLLFNKFTSDRPNILLIMTDEQSANAMSWRIGENYLKTPVMDEIARRGTFFNNTYCANPLCVPSRTSIFTGLYPHQTKVQTNSDIKVSVSSIKCMGTIFKEAGYDTGYTGKWHLPFPEKETSAHGFDYMRSIKNNGVDKDVPQSAAEFLKIKRDKPFLLVTSFVDPHNIAEWARGENLPDGEIGTPPSADQCPPLLSNHLPMKNESDADALIRKSFQMNKLFPVGNFDDTKWRQYRWAYYRLIEKVDAQIGKVISALKNSGNYENTLIVFMSDHGDMQGAHLWSQKTILFEEASRVPLIICEPGRSKHEELTPFVNTGIDLLPTLCDYAGIKIPGYLPGRSLKHIGNKEDREYIVVENKMIQGSPVDGIKPEPSGRMVRSKKYKYVVYDIRKRRESLVDLENDPGEMVNLAEEKEYQGVLENHRQSLREWCKKYNDTFAI